MQNTIILILVIVLVVVGGILYLYRDTVKGKYNRTSGKVKETVSNAVKQVKQDVKD